MSAKYSTSPALRLIVGNSSVRCYLYAVLCLCGAAALYLLYARGYPLLCSVLLPPVVCLLLRLRRDPMVGSIVQWRQGIWTMERAQAVHVVRVLPQSACLPWVIYLAWRELPGGKRGDLWLFPDSASAEQLRRLRVRLSLQR